MAESIKSPESLPEGKDYYRMLIQDYGNTAMRLGVLLRRAKENPVAFHDDFASHPKWGEKITEYFSEKATELREAFPKEIEEMDTLMDRIKTEDDPAIIKRAINKLLMIIYPTRGTNQEFEGEEFSADKSK